MEDLVQSHLYIYGSFYTGGLEVGTITGFPSRFKVALDTTGHPRIESNIESLVYSHLCSKIKTLHFSAVV